MVEFSWSNFQPLLCLKNLWFYVRTYWIDHLHHCGIQTNREIYNRFSLFLLFPFSRSMMGLCSFCTMFIPSIAFVCVAWISIFIEIFFLQRISIHSMHSYENVLQTFDRSVTLSVFVCSTCEYVCLRLLCVDALSGSIPWYDCNNFVVFVSVWQSVFCFFFRHLIATIKIDDTTNKWFDDFYSVCVCAWVCARVKPIQTSSLVTFSVAIVYRIWHLDTCFPMLWNMQPAIYYTHSLTHSHTQTVLLWAFAFEKRKCTT